MTIASTIGAPRAARASDRDAILELLRRAALPTADIEAGTPVEFWVVPDGDRPVGAIGLERYGADGLLRSLVVDPDHRSRGLGMALVAALERAARSSGIQRLVLLTETARPFFERRGYALTPRNSIAAEIADSTEFRSLCPASATCMTKVFQ
jgi:amino-acid N-acetyltransferase